MTRLVRFTNNATSRLASGLSAIGLTMSVTPGDGAKFPVIAGGQFFKATLIKVDGTKEVVKVTARTADTMTIERAHESVGGVQTAYIFSAGDKVELRLTAEALSDELDRLDAAAFLDVSNKSTNYTILESDVSKLIKTSTASGTITHTLPQISTLTGSFEVQISKETGDANLVTINRAGTDTINGLTSYNLSSQYQCVWLVADLSTNTWTAITSASATNAVVDVFTGAGSAGPFTLSGDPGTKNNTVVHVGGVYQNKATYTIVGDQLTLGGTVGVGVMIEVEWAQPMAIGTPSDGTVTTLKLAGGAVTIAKTTGIAASGANTDISSLASPALASSTATTQVASDNTTKVATTAMVQSALKQSGKVLKVQGFTDGGNSTASVSAVVLNSARWSYTPVSTNSTLFLIVTGQCYATALASAAGSCIFYIGEYSGADNVVSAGVFLQSQEFSTTYAQQIYAPLAIQVKLSNTSLTTRLFEIMGQSFNAGVTIGANGALTVIEVAN